MFPEMTSREASLTEPQPYARPAAASGMAFVVLMFGALFAPGPPPRASDSAMSIADGLADHRGVILVATWFAGLGLLAGIWFFATVAGWLASGASPQQRASAQAAAGSGVVGVVLAVVGLLLFYGATFEVAGGGQLGVVRGLTDAGNATIEMSKFGICGFIAGTSLIGRANGRLSRRFAGAGLFSASAGLLSTIAIFSEASFTQFGGGLDLVGAAPAILWLVALSLSMTRRARS